MKVLYFGLYDPNYARNWVLINGLRRNNVEATELRRKPSRFNFIKLFFDYLKLETDYDVMIVGFPGQGVMLLARLLTRKPIIFDAFTSHYGGYILDRQINSPRSLRAKYYRFLDKWSCRLADLVLLDTQAHIDFFVKEYGLKKEKFKRIWVGANDEIFYPRETKKEGQTFIIIFFGTYIPLQGVEYIVKAAEILKDYPDIIFKLIGRGQEKPKVISLVNELKLKNIVFEDMLSQEKLALEISKADISLGIFGDTLKTPLVIPNKVFIAAAMKKAIITADTQAIRELFTEDDLLLVEAADPKSLAEGVLKLKNSPNIGMTLANNGYNKFKEMARPNVLGLELKNIIISLI